MKHKHLALLLSTLALSALGYADQPSSTDNKSADQTKKTPFVEYDNRILFLPLHIGYERIKPNAVYVGIEGYLTPLVNKGNESLLWDAEFRLGYNFFFKGRDHLTPIVGLGYVQDFFEHDDHTIHKPAVLYGLIGFLYCHEFNAKFNLGFNSKFLMGGPLSQKRFDWGSPVMGADISVPITFRFGKRKNWDYCLEPFTMYLHGSKTQQWFVGFRSSFGYRF